jgi:hypothetical protein
MTCFWLAAADPALGFPYFALGYPIGRSDTLSGARIPYPAAG